MLYVVCTRVAERSNFLLPHIHHKLSYRGLTGLCVCIQDNQKAVAEEKRKDEELDRQVLLAEQRREEERLQQEERQREKMEKIKAVEGRLDRCRWNTNGKLYNTCLCSGAHIQF